MKTASVELQGFMLKQIKDAVEKHKEETKSNKPLYLVMNTRDFKRMRSVRAMKARAHYYSFVPEGTFYLSETKPNPKDYEPKLRFINNQPEIKELAGNQDTYYTHG